MLNLCGHIKSIRNGLTPIITTLFNTINRIDITKLSHDFTNLVHKPIMIDSIFFLIHFKLSLLYLLNVGFVFAFVAVFRIYPFSTVFKGNPSFRLLLIRCNCNINPLFYLLRCIHKMHPQNAHTSQY